MNQLNTLQHQFWNSLRNVRFDSSCSSLISVCGNLSEEDRLNIYRNTMRTAHITTLSECFNCCEKILGDRYFNKIANEYFYSNPAISQNLNVYGRTFPSFLQTWVSNHPETKDYEYLPDLAKLEYAFEQAHYCKNDPLFDFNSFSKLEEYEQQQIIFQLSHSLTILKSRFPIYEIWHVNNKQDNAQEVDSISEPQYLCITRDVFKPIIHKIDAQKWWVLNNIQRSLSLEKIHMLSQDENINVPLNIIIPELIKKKWICGYLIETHPS